MTGLETALAAAGLKVLGKKLVEWLKSRGGELSESDWAKMGIFIGKKLTVDYKNIESSWLHKSRKKKVVRRIESAAEIYRELELIGEERGFDEDIIETYSGLADICSNWSIGASRHPDLYEERAQEYFEVEEEYRESVSEKYNSGFG